MINFLYSGGIVFKFLSKCKDSIFWGYDYDAAWSTYSFLFSLKSYSGYLKDFDQVVEEKRLYWKSYGKYYGNSEYRSEFPRYAANHAVFRAMIDCFNCVYNSDKNESLAYELSKKIHDEHQMFELIGEPFKDMHHIAWNWKKAFKKYEKEKELSMKNAEAVKALSFERAKMDLAKNEISNGNSNNEAKMIRSAIPLRGRFTTHFIMKSTNLSLEIILFWLLVFVEIGILKMYSFGEPEFWAPQVRSLKHYFLMDVLCENKNSAMVLNLSIIEDAVRFYTNYVTKNTEETNKNLINLVEKILDLDIRSELKKSALELEDMWKEFEKKFGRRGAASSKEEANFRDPVVKRSTKRQTRAVNEQLRRLNYLNMKTLHHSYDEVVLDKAPWE